MKEGFLPFAYYPGKELIRLIFPFLPEKTAFIDTNTGSTILFS